MGCASTKLICISDQNRSKFTIVLVPQLYLLVNKIPMSFLGPSSVVCLQQFLCWGKEKPWTCVCIKDFVSHLHQLFCTEFFTPSALKHQHFPFLVLVSFEEHFAMLRRRMPPKIKHCLSVYCSSCSSDQVIFWPGTRQ